MLAFPGRAGAVRGGQGAGRAPGPVGRRAERPSGRRPPPRPGGGKLRAVDPDEVATMLWASWNGVISLGCARTACAALRRNCALLRIATDVVAHGLLPADGASEMDAPTAMVQPAVGK